LEKKELADGRGAIRVATHARNQRGEIVLTLEREIVIDRMTAGKHVLL
jgi:acyl dehydratase